MQKRNNILIRLDKNESPFDPPYSLKKEILKEFLKEEWSRYPVNEKEIKKLISDYAEFESEGIALGNGSNELIQAIFLRFLGTGKNVILPEPCFSIYPWMASLIRTIVTFIPMDENFKYNAKDFIEKTKRASPDLVVLISPHNPCGSEIPENALEDILESKISIVLIDEAYYEFSGKSFKDYIKNYKNLIVLRTFSKAFSIAGLRAGYILANPELVKLIEDSKPPFSVSSFTLLTLKYLLKNRNYLKNIVEEIKKERERVFEELKKIKGIQPFPSSGNFILFKTEEISVLKIYELMLKKGIVLRKFDSKNLHNCLRVTIGKKYENRKFIKTLKEVINEIKE